MRDPLRRWVALIKIQTILSSKNKLVKVDQLTNSLLNVGRSLLSGSGLRKHESNEDLLKDEQRLYSNM